MSLLYATDVSFLPSENKNDDFILKNIHSFFLELSEDKSGNLCKNFYFTLKGSKRKKVQIFLDDLDLFNTDRTEMLWRKNFHEIKAGDAVVCAHPEVFLLKNFNEILVGGFQNADWDIVLPEGSYVTVLEKAKIEDFYFVKVLHQASVFWAFGALYRAEPFELQQAKTDHHFI